MTLDVVYPLRRKGSTYGDNELRYSLRGIERNMAVDAIGTVWLYGHRPEWVRDIEHVKMDDYYDKAVNLQRKYEAMMANAALSDPFLLMDDDHFFLAPTTAIPLYARGTLDEHAPRRPGIYGAYMRAAMHALRAAGLPTRNYQIHFPMLIEKARLAKTLAIMTKPMVMASVYGNVGDGPAIETPNDFRVTAENDLHFFIDAPYCSVVDAMLLRVEAAILAKRLPTPSRWERT